MKRLVGHTLMIALCAIVVRNVSAEMVTATPAEQKIAAAQKRIDMRKPDAIAYAELAMAYAKRARETADPVFYEKGHEAVAKALQLESDSFEAQKAKVWLLLGQHEFAKARELADKLNKRTPDDVTVYGLLVDANAELGRYAEAEKAAQWMLDLRAGNIPGLLRAAYLRELFGDAEGALELMQQVYNRTPELETEERAWLLAQIGHLNRAMGRVDVAERALTKALELFPKYHYALAELARVRTHQSRAADAAELFGQRYEVAPHPENLYDLAVAQKRAGKLADASKSFAAFEKAALQESEGADNANRELIHYYIDHANKPKAALKISQREIEARQDVWTLGAHAWALHKNGKHAEARKFIDQALAVGVRDPQLFYHAGEIAKAQNDRAAAKRYFAQALKSAPEPAIKTATVRALKPIAKAEELIELRIAAVAN